MDYEVLGLKVEEERQLSEFANIDPHYLEISRLLLSHAREDVPEW
jgi:hypothetical protein